MADRKYNVSLRSLILAIVFFINSLVLYVPDMYARVYEYYTIISILMLIVSVVAVANFKFEKKSAIITILIVVIAYIDIFFNKLPVGEYFPLIWLFVLVYCFRQLEDWEIINSIFTVICFVFWLYLIIYSVKYHSEFVQMIDTETVRRILNPNIVGSGIAQFSLIFISTHVDSSEKKNKLNILNCLISFFGIFMCDARASAIFYITSLIVFVLISKRGFKFNKISKVFVMFVVVIGFVFPFILIALFNKYGFGTMFLGKSLFTGRERIWATLFQYMREHPIAYFFGAGKIEELFWHERFNLHSSYLALFTEYGLIVSILFWIRIVKILHSKIDNIYSMEIWSGTVLSSSSKALIGFFVFVVYSLLTAYTETNYTYILSLIYIAMALGFLSRSSS